MSELQEAKLTPMELRAKLEDMVVKDLLGPAGGEHEELIERTVRGRYLVGVLAPRPKGDGGIAASPAAEEEDDEDIPLIPDELSEGGADSVDDGITDLNVPVPRAGLPSSSGATWSTSRRPPTP